MVSTTLTATMLSAILPRVKLFIAFNSLIAWLARNKLHFDYLGTYVDDSFGVDVVGDTLFYAPYNKFLPRHQVLLHNLWDELRIPHKEKKQVFGSPLTVIGIDVNPNAKTLILPDPAKSQLLAELDKWSSEPHPKTSTDKSKLHRRSTVHFPLRRWQQLTGWLNWSFNVFPILRPCLNAVYPKPSGKEVPHQRIYSNTTIRADLRWAKQHIEVSSGINLLEHLASGSVVTV